jgi:hypothetical protein
LSLSTGDIDVFSFRSVAVGATGNSITLRPQGAGKLDGATVTLIDSIGALIGQGTLQADGTVRLDLAGIEAGSYLLDIENVSGAPVDYSVELQLPTVAGPAVVADFSLDSSFAIGGSRLFATAIFTNAGSAVAPPHRARLVRSRDDQIDSNDAIITESILIPELDPGETFTATIPVTVSPALSTGLVLFLLDPDADHVVQQPASFTEAVAFELTVGLVPDRLVANDAFGEASEIGPLKSTSLEGLSIDSDTDTDYFTFRLVTTGTEQDYILLDIKEEDAEAVMLLFDSDQLAAGIAIGQVDPANPRQMRLSMDGLTAGRYYLKLSNPAEKAFHYALDFRVQAREGANLSVESLRSGSGIWRIGTRQNLLVEVSNSGTQPVGQFQIFAYFQEGDVLRVRAAMGLEREVELGFTLSVGEGFAGTIAAESKPLALASASSDPLVKSPVLRQKGLKALYGVPLVHNGAVIGVAHMGSALAREFSDEDKLLFRTMANRATAVIVQADLVERERQAHKDLQEAHARLVQGVESERQARHETGEALARVDSLLSAAPVGVAVTV